MDAAEDIFNNGVVSAEIIRHWREKADGRKTIAFCSTIKHAEDLSKAFTDAGIKSDYITGDTPTKVRKSILEDFDQGDLVVLCNVAVLTEGYDSQPASCAILARPCSYKSTAIQIIGRVLRVVDSKKYPGVVKKDAIVLDFGTTLKKIEDLDEEVNLDGAEKGINLYLKECPQCGEEVPSATKKCPNSECGFIFETFESDDEDDEAIKLGFVTMVELEIIKKSPFRWIHLYNSPKLMVSSGVDFCSMVISRNSQDWYAFGGLKGKKIQHLTTSNKTAAISTADDFIRKHGSSISYKNRRWLDHPMSKGQLNQLEKLKMPLKRDRSLTKNEASAYIAFGINKKQIEQIIGAN